MKLSKLINIIEGHVLIREATKQGYAIARGEILLI